MQFYLESCRRNPDIEWLFFTDCGIPPNVPDNVRIIEMSYQAYCQLVSTRLGIDFYPEQPYKLCDIKPALGYLHANQLEDVDFWAFGDIDVIYGDLRRYFTAERLAAKDLFATHHRRVSGHLCLMRNTALMREAFMRIPRWRERYADPAHQALDEGAFSRLFIRHKNWPEGLRLFAARFCAWGRRSEFIESHSTFTLHADGRKVVPQKWFLCDGRLTNSEMGDTELPYLHFLVWKNEHWKAHLHESLLGPEGLAFSPGWEVSETGWQESKG
jgi:hypothetical protein